MYLIEDDLPNKKFNKILNETCVSYELKIGINAGRFLCKMITEYKKNYKENKYYFVGVELKTDKSEEAYDLVCRKKLTNVSVVNMEALSFITTYLDDSTFNNIHIYFPTPLPFSIGLTDPLVSPEFVDQAYRILKPLGSLRLVTDQKFYYDDASKHFHFDKWWAVEWQELKLGQPENFFLGSSLEKKYRKSNSNIYSFQVIKW